MRARIKVRIAATKEGQSVTWSYPVLDAVAELIEREPAVGKTAVCGRNSGFVRPVFSCIGAEFGIRQQHRFDGVLRAWV